MVLSKNLIHEYQETYKRKFGEGISSKEAERELFDLKELVRLITKERRKLHVARDTRSCANNKSSI